MKKRLLVFFALIVSISSLCKFNYSNWVAAEENFETKSNSIYLIDNDSKTVLIKKNELEHRKIASMTKIMTLLLSFEELDNGKLSLNEQIKVSENASKMGGSQVFLEKDAYYPASDLIKSIVVASANDSSVAMAERISGSESAFVEKMNKKCKELSMNNTVFVNCTGLPAAGQYSCAKDVATMFSELIKHKEYFDFSSIWMDKIMHPMGRYTEISNTNKLIKFYDGCDSGKTGYTSEAGHCLCASAKRDNMRLISVVISSPDSKTRFKEASSLFNYGFNNFVNKLLVDSSVPLEMNVGIRDGKTPSVSVIPEKSLYLFSKRNDDRVVDVNFEPIDGVVAPIVKGDVLGNIYVYENGVQISSTKVLACETVYSKSYIDRVYNIAKNWSII